MQMIIISTVVFTIGPLFVFTRKQEIADVDINVIAPENELFDVKINRARISCFSTQKIISNV